MTAPTKSWIRRWRTPLLTLMLLALTASGIWWKTRPEPIAVTVHTVALGAVEATVSNTRAGSVEACRRTRLSTLAGGRIVWLGVKEGDHVTAGQPLLRLWNDDQAAQTTLASTQVELARRRMDEVCSQAGNAEREAKRQTRLREQGFVSESKEEAARTEAEARNKACITARADITQAEAKLAVTRVEHGRTTLVAPFAGIVAKIVGELGEYSTPSPPGISTPPAIDLIDTRCLYVKAPMDEIDAPRIRPGQPARLSFDALPGITLKGRVRRVAPYVLAVEKQSRTVEIEIGFDAPADAQKLLVGYSADVEILLDRRDAVLRVPASAIQEGRRVLLLNPQTNRLETREIRTGMANWEYAEVIAGLKAGDQVVTSLDRDGVKAGILARASAAAPGKPSP
ncbi:MAG: efflux RND transporter periplasmic adaptor subunit [Betaproteobacteria bacterium]|nr:efflux RND transporter periplasmic adaptor subunit [Betaproteobacteria bacterium]